MPLQQHVNQKPVFIKLYVYSIYEKRNGRESWTESYSGTLEGSEIVLSLSSSFIFFNVPGGLRSTSTPALRSMDSSVCYHAATWKHGQTLIISDRKVSPRSWSCPGPTETLHRMTLSTFIHISPCRNAFEEGNISLTSCFFLELLYLPGQRLVRCGLNYKCLIYYSIKKTSCQRRLLDEESSTFFVVTDYDL